MRKLTYLLFMVLLFFGENARSQGCIAIRNLAGFGQFAQLGYAQTKDKWMMDVDNRYFAAHTVLFGRTNETPKDLSSGVSLHEWTTNFEITRLLANDWSLTLDVPISSNETLGKLEHAQLYYHVTHAFGLGDIRFSLNKWLLTKVSDRGNIQVGLGIKFPTGNYHSEDYFYEDPNNPSAATLAPVNVAVQLGDGGTGFTTQINGFYILSTTVNLFGNFFYLISPRDQNGVAAWVPGSVPASFLALQQQTTADVNSVPDNYTMRGGANFSFDKLVATAAMRYEGVPAHDLFGQNDGERKAGHIFSVEPGLQYKFKKSLLYAFTTIPVDRETIQTVPDQRATKITGTYMITGGHFANTLFFLGYSFTF
ncbi:MAG TPA: hypothetical protein VK787_10555 [Puia sp.]|jgi:hypothetical protein|nr:hypothetical protein [Puia sp.]